MPRNTLHKEGEWSECHRPFANTSEFNSFTSECQRGCGLYNNGSCVILVACELAQKGQIRFPYNSFEEQKYVGGMRCRSCLHQEKEKENSAEELRNKSA